MWNSGIEAREPVAADEPRAERVTCFGAYASRDHCSGGDSMFSSRPRIIPRCGPSWTAPYTPLANQNQPYCICALATSERRRRDPALFWLEWLPLTRTCEQIIHIDIPASCQRGLDWQRPFQNSPAPFLPPGRHHTIHRNSAWKHSDRSLTPRVLPTRVLEPRLGLG